MPGVRAVVCVSPFALLAGRVCGRAPGSVPPTEDRAAIVGGTVDAVDTSVVAILVELPGGSGYLCTGSVIGPHSVVTAGHCAADFTAGAQGSVITDGVLGPNPAFVARIDRFEPHPQYHQAQGAGDWSDIGMAHTVEALPGPYLPLNRYPLDRLQLEGQPVIDVGYGTIGADAGGSGVRRSVVKHDVTVRSAPW